MTTHRIRTVPGRRALASLLALLLLVTSAAPGLAWARTPSTPVALVTVSGTVTRALSTTAIAGVEVTVWAYDGFEPTPVRALTAANGRWSVQIPENVEFDVQFDPSDTNAANGTHYLVQWANGAGSTTDRRPDMPAYPGVISGEPVDPAPDAKLPSGGSLAGTVTAGDGAGPLADVRVEVYDGLGSFVDTLWTGADGTYRTALRTPAPGGGYRLHFDPSSSGAGDYLARWLGLATSDVASPKLPVTPGALSAGHDIALPLGAVISGIVRTPEGSGAASVGVLIADPLTGTVRDAFTAASGTYRVSGLEAATYTVRFDPDTPTGYDPDSWEPTGSFNAAAGTDYCAQYWDDAPGYAPDAARVFAAEARSGVDATLHAGVLVSGTVRSQSGDPLAGVSVIAAGGSANEPGWVTTSTAADGTYAIGRLASDAYRITFDPTALNAETGAGYVGASTDITVTAPGAAPGTDATLPLGSVISGRVTDASGAALPSITVSAETEDEGWALLETQTAADGTYRLAGVPTPNRVRIRFDTFEYNDVNDTDLVTGYWRGAGDRTLADVIVVGAEPAPYTSRDATIQAGGRLSGTIRDGSGGAPVPVADAFVELVTPEGRWLDVAFSGDAGDPAGLGAYEFRGLAPGAYKLAARLSGLTGPSLPLRYHVDKPTLAAANPIAVNPRAASTRKDITLLASGAISGRVTRQGTSTGLPGVAVLVFDADGMLVDRVETGAEGLYVTESTDLVEGRYTVRFDPSDLNAATGSDYASQWYAAKASPTAATPVAVAYGATSANVNAQLVEDGRSIRGTLATTGGGNPASGGRALRVTALQLHAGEWAHVAEADVSTATGAFEIGALQPGTYRLVAAQVAPDVPAADALAEQVFFHRSDPSTSVVESVGWPAAGTDVVVPAAGDKSIGTWTVGFASALHVTVRDADGALVPGAAVFGWVRVPGQTAWQRYAGDGWLGDLETGAGEVSRDWSGGMLPGDWRISVVAPGYEECFYRDARTVTGAETMYLRQRALTPGSDAIEMTLPGEAYAPDRATGADRFAVAADLASRTADGYAGTTHVVIASGEDRAAADPLSAAGLAGAYRAPILLVRSTFVPKATEDALRLIKARNGNRRVTVHVVGGPASVPDKVVARVKALLPAKSTSERFTGADRYAVAVAVAARVRSVTKAKTAFVTNGSAPAYFFYALAASPACYANGYPLLLTRSTGLTPATDAEQRNYQDKWVIGDEAAVPESIRAKLWARRISGSDRTEVAAAFAQTAAELGWLDVSRVAVGNALADALTGGVAVGADGGVLVYTRDASTLSDPTTRFFVNQRGAVSRVLLLGGPASIEPSVGAAITGLLR